MTSNIAFVSKNDDYLPFVQDLFVTDKLQLSRIDLGSLAEDKEYEFPVVIVDYALINDESLNILQQLCAKQDRVQPFMFVIADKLPSEKKSIEIYGSGVVDILLTTTTNVILRAKIDSYVSCSNAYDQRVLCQQHTCKQTQLLEFHATHDYLTGIYNHLYFQESIARELATSIESGADLGLLMLDIDFFKEVNDSYGHQVGDIVLNEFAKLVENIISDECTWCRYGGEEFMLIVPKGTKETIQQLATAIRLETEKFVFCEERSKLHVTVSIGATIYSEGDDSVSTIIEQADHALYQAKAMGRNRLVWYELNTTTDHLFDASDKFAGVRDRLRATLEKTRSSALASFEAMVHSQTRDKLTLQARNKLALQMVNLLCKRLNLPRNVSQSFRRAFKLHDLLRLFISDSTLEKTGSLSEAEMLAIEDQPLMLKQLTDLFDFFADERMILRYHHECFDGSGYPEGLDGQDIPMGARLFTIVDAYVAMILPSYKRPLKNKEEVVEEFSRMSGKQFDPFLVHLVIDIISDEGFSDLIDEQCLQGDF